MLVNRIYILLAESNGPVSLIHKQNHKITIFIYLKEGITTPGKSDVLQSPQYFIRNGGSKLIFGITNYRGKRIILRENKLLLKLVSAVFLTPIEVH